MAYCGSDCRKHYGWGSDCPGGVDDPTYSCQPQNGFHDWGNSVQGTALIHFACRWQPELGVRDSNKFTTQVRETSLRNQFLDVRVLVPSLTPDHC